jgi:hypothetical protein
VRPSRELGASSVSLPTAGDGPAGDATNWTDELGAWTSGAVKLTDELGGRSATGVALLFARGFACGRTHGASPRTLPSARIASATCL